MSKLTDGLKLRAQMKRKGAPVAPSGNTEGKLDVAKYTPKGGAKQQCIECKDWREMQHFTDSRFPAVCEGCVMNHEVKLLLDEQREILATIETDVVEPGSIKMPPPPDPGEFQPGMESIPMRLCKRCNPPRLREFKYFNKSKAYASGYMPVCVDCEYKYVESGEAAQEQDAAKPVKRTRNRKRAVSFEHYKVRRLLVAACSRALRQGSAYDLHSHTAELEERLSRGVCEMTKLPFDMDTPLAYNAPALYPVDPAKGMVYSNIRIICWGMLCALGTWGPKDLETLVTAWLEHQ